MEKSRWNSRLAAAVCLALFSVSAEAAIPEIKFSPGEEPVSVFSGFSLAWGGFRVPDAELLPFPNPSVSYRPAWAVKNENEIESYFPKKRTGRAVIELSAFMMTAQVHYWLKYYKFIEDWQFRLNFKDQAKRFFTLEAIRFDSNAYYLNWSHSFAGAVYYQFARTNYFSWRGAWLTSMIGSLWWEYVAEWREIISINDLIFTGIGGLPFGEAWFQLSNFLASSDSPFFGLLSFINPALKLNRWFDRKKLRGRHFEFGWHRFSVEVGARSLKKTGGYEFNDFFGFRTEIINPAGYGRTGSSFLKIKDIYSSSIVGNIARADGATQEANLWLGVRGPGKFRQEIDDLGRGYTLYFGIGSAFSYFRKRPVEFYDAGVIKANERDKLLLDEPRNFRDKLSTVHVAGPVVDWTLRRRGLQMRTQVEGYLDFAMPNAYALNEYSREHDISGMKTTVMFYGYYYGLGGTLSGKAEARLGNLDVSGEALYQRWDSIEGRDRFQADLTDDCDLDDSRTMLTAAASWRIPDSFVDLFFRYEYIKRWGKIHDFTMTGSERRTFIGLRFVF